MKQPLLYLICILACSQVHPAAANAANLSGVVIDRASQEPLAGVVIQIVGSRFGETTDDKGRFHLEGVGATPLQLRLSRLGYSEQFLKVERHGDLGTIPLKAAAIRLSQVVVTPGSYAVIGDGPMGAPKAWSFSSNTTRDARSPGGSVMPGPGPRRRSQACNSTAS